LQALIGSAILWSEVVPFCRPLLVPFSKPRATNGLIPKKNYGEVTNKKPDGLVLSHRTPKAVVEFKVPAKLRTEKGVVKAIGQEIAVAKALCKILILTDGNATYWVNALNGEFIKDNNGSPVTTVFNPTIVRNTNAVEHLIEEIDASITRGNSVIRCAKLLDPMPLATRLWQTIWVATAKSPVKCLYNVVELFIFKFLSDLKVLPEDISFSRVYEKATADPAEALEYCPAPVLWSRLNVTYPPPRPCPRGGRVHIVQPLGPRLPA